MPDPGWTAQGDDPPLTWAVAGRAKQGENVSGDQFTVHVAGRRVVIAVIDGLGHGPEAETAARRAIEVVDNHPAEPLDALILLAHRELSETRGVAATMAAIDGKTGAMSWLGVGNVDGVLIRAEAATRPRTRGAFLVGGVLGYRVGSLHLPEPITLQDGDVLLLATDGVHANLAEVARLDKPVDRLAGMILAKYSRPDDDALVLAARYQAPALPDGEPDDPPRERSIYQPLNPSAQQSTDGSKYQPLGPSSTQ